MKEHKRKTQNKQEQSDQEHHLNQRNSQSLADNLSIWKQGGVSITETPFEPAADSHASLLAQTRFDVQRANLARQLQQSYGNAYVQRLLESMGAQAKVTVGAPNDIYEQEADRVAEKVVGSLNSQVQRQEEEEELQMKHTSEIQRQEEEEGRQMQTAEEQEEELQMKRASELQRQEEEEEELMMKADEGSAAQLSKAVEARINAACGNGKPLSAGIREPMEQAFGADFNAVRTHTDSEADVLNRQLSARAFTRGQDIFFREGEYSPGSEEGKKLIAHELTHVVQQAEIPAIQRQGKMTDDEDSRAVASSPVSPQVRRIGLGLILAGEQTRRPELIEYGREFLRTGQLRVLSLATNVMAKPQFVGVSLQHLKRGATVTVLDTEGSWYRVRTDEGKEGWVHVRPLTPPGFRLRSVPTKGGSTRGEAEVAGRG